MVDPTPIGVKFGVAPINGVKFGVMPIDGVLLTFEWFGFLKVGLTHLTCLVSHMWDSHRGS